jgi:hypothetical protein
MALQFFFEPGWKVVRNFRAATLLDWVVSFGTAALCILPTLVVFLMAEHTFEGVTRYLPAVFLWHAYKTVLEASALNALWTTVLLVFGFLLMLAAAAWARDLVLSRIDRALARS